MASKISSPKKLPYGILPILDPRKAYKHSTEGVNVQDIWKKHGWVPPQQQKQGKTKEY